ncbi:MAG: hypothetical protein RLZZ488_426 [Pseudomonadota bacterium]
MRNIAENIFRHGAVMACTLLCIGQAAAAEPLLIRGDQSVPLLSEVPVAVNSSYEIFTVKPRRTSRDELISILGNADLFLTPPSDKRSGNAADSKKVEKVQSGDGQ